MVFTASLFNVQPEMDGMKKVAALKVTFFKKALYKTDLFVAER